MEISLEGSRFSQRRLEGIIFPFILGALVAVGTYGASMATIPFRSITFYSQIMLYAFVFYWLFQFGLFIVRKNAVEEAGTCISGHVKGSNLFHKVCSFEYVEGVLPSIRDGLRLFVCWSPYLVLLYPGILYWDTGDQLGQFFGISVFGQKPGMIWDHHPFFDTFMYGSVVSTGKSLFGSYQSGIFLYSLLQFIVMDLVLAVWLGYLAQRGATRRWLKYITLFIAFFPVFPVMSLAMSKDITHAAIFLLWTLLFSKLVFKRMELLHHIGFDVVFLCVTLLAALTKKIGLYIIVACLIVALFVRCRAYLKIILASFGVITVLISNVVIPTYLFPVLHVIPGGPQAALAVPIQMTARVSAYHHEDITDSEKLAIDGFLLNSWDELGTKYVPFISDPVTAYNVRDANKQSDFMRAWLSIGLRHPMTYFNSFVAQQSGWISFVGSSQASIPVSPYPTMPLQMQLVTTTKVNPDSFGRLLPNRNPNKRQSLLKHLLVSIMSIPGINSIFYTAIWTVILPVFLIFLLWIFRKRTSHENIIELIPYFISWLSLFAYPVSLTISQDPTRYMFHLVILLPLMLTLVTTFFTSDRDCLERCVSGFDRRSKGSVVACEHADRDNARMVDRGKELNK